MNIKEESINYTSGMKDETGGTWDLDRKGMKQFTIYALTIIGCVAFTGYSIVKFIFKLFI